jgi:hypothetical protein
MNHSDAYTRRPAMLYPNELEPSARVSYIKGAAYGDEIRSTLACKLHRSPLGRSHSAIQELRLNYPWNAGQSTRRTDSIIMTGHWYAMSVQSQGISASGKGDIALDDPVRTQEVLEQVLSVMPTAMAGQSKIVGNMCTRKAINGLSWKAATRSD